MKKLLGMIGSVAALCAFADGTVVLQNCSTTVTDTASAPFGESAIALKGATLQFAPTLASGESWSGTLGAVTSDNGANRIDISRGSGSSATVTLDSLAVADPQTLVITAGKGVTALGDTERVKVTGMTANEGLSPAYVTRSMGSENAPFKFMAYDADKGFYSVADYTYKPNAGDDRWGNALIDKPFWVNKDTTIHGNIYVTTTNNIAIDSGKTLTVNKSWGSVGIVFSSAKRANNQVFNLKNGGTLSFGNAAAWFWTFCGATTWNTGYSSTYGRIVRFGVKVSGPNYKPVTFGGHANDSREYPSYDFSQGDYIKWNGPTHIVGARFVLSPSASFQNEVYVHGGTTLTAGQLRLVSNNGTINPKVHLAGEGPSGDGAVHNTGAVVWTFAGGTVLEGDTYITHDNAPCGTVFKGAVSGEGRLALGQGRFDFHAAGSNVGGMELRSDNTVLNVYTNGTLGTGAVVAQGGKKATVNFIGQYRAVQPAVSVPDGTINVVDSRVDSFGGLSAKTVTQSGLVDATVTDDVSLGQFAQAGTVRLTAGADPVTVSAGSDGDDFAFGGELNDGDVKMGFAKTGSNVVTLYRAGTASGPLSVKGGTLKLTDDIMSSPELSWWLDASQESTLTRDGTGRVTEWRSANGNGVTFAPTAFGANVCPAPLYTAKDAVDSLPGVTFAASETNSIAANVKTAQRTVILVTRPAESQSQWSNGAFGRLNSDYGQRYTSSGYWNRDAGKVSFQSSATHRYNGQDCSYNAMFAGELHIAVFTHDENRDATSTSVTGNQNLEAEYFVPALGGYYNPFTNPNENPRFFSGEICEAMAFGRILSADELARVENYLSKKWLKKTVHATVPAYDALGGAPVAVDENATLEIDCPITIRIGENGVVNPIVGAGKVKLGANAALTVVADCDFAKIPKAAYTLISAQEGVEGSFKSVSLPRRSWHVEADETTFAVDTRSGMSIIFR